MKGLELSKRYYEEYGAPMLDGKFPELRGKIAVGLFGAGSECFGYDDGISRDHDYEPSFIIVLPSEEEVSRRQAFLLEREYDKLPAEFIGVKRNKVDPVGGSRRGVIRAEDFFMQKTGKKDGLLSGDEWFTVPEHYLAEAVNGEVFRDDAGTFSATREYLSSYPKDVLLKKLAGNLLLAAQAGQYNYPRMIKRGDTAGAQVCAAEFVKRAMNAAFLIEKKYRPYYKWSFRALSELPEMKNLYSSLEYLLSSDNSPENAAKKTETTENVCALLAAAVSEKYTGEKTGNDLERLAYAVNGKISDPVLRNKSVFYGV